MYKVRVICPSVEARDRLLRQGITTLCFAMVEGMHFESREDAHAYMEYMRPLYPELSIQYTVYRAGS